MSKSVSYAMGFVLNTGFILLLETLVKTGKE